MNTLFSSCFILVTRSSHPRSPLALTSLAHSHSQALLALAQFLPPPVYFRHLFFSLLPLFVVLPRILFLVSLSAYNTSVIMINAHSRKTKTTRILFLARLVHSEVFFLHYFFFPCVVCFTDIYSLANTFSLSLRKHFFLSGKFA